MNLIKDQIAYGQSIRPEGELQPVWASLLQDWVNRESLIEWGKNHDPALPLFFSEKPTPVPLLRSLIGILP